MLVNIRDHTQAPKLAQEQSNRVVYSRLSQFENHRLHLGISLKYVMSGEEAYQIEGTPYRVKAGQYLLVNHHRELHTSIPSAQPVEGLCLYLRTDLVEEVQAAIEGAAPDQPWEGARRLPVFHEQVYESRTSLPGKRLRRLAAQLDSGAGEICTDEAFYYDAAVELLADQRAVRRALGRLDCVKSSTREELYRRLEIARSFLHDHLSEDLDLDRVAQEACLSKFHFIRLFRQVYGKTPHQYLISLRLEKARKLLLHTQAALSDICLEIGLRDLSSFGRRFKRVYGQNPSEYRILNNE